MDARGVVIFLIGPGGAGKSTVGTVLARLLHQPFVDLDRLFEATWESIDAYIALHGYAAYTAANIALAAALDYRTAQVVALSSGFMTYATSVHPFYAELRERIIAHDRTFVLLPSRDRETCVEVTVRRQLSRNLPARSAAAEERKIRERFSIYSSLPANLVVTERSPEKVARDIQARLGAFRPKAAGAGAI